MHQTSLSLLAIIVALLGLFVWRARPEKSVNRWFSIFTLAVAVWSLSVAGLYTGYHPWIWSRLMFAAASLIPATYLAFIHNYPVFASLPSALVLRCAHLI